MNQGSEREGEKGKQNKTKQKLEITQLYEHFETIGRYQADLLK